MTDIFKTATLPDEGLSIGIALTTATCREATRLHELKATSSIALGRLISCTALAGLMQEKPGALSMQIVSNGRLKQLYADVTATGHLRGYVLAPDLDLPLFSNEAQNGRRAIAAGFGSGHLSVIRNADVHDFAQSTTELVHKEVDTDVLHYLETSDQNATALRADTLLDAHGNVDLSGAILVQALPDANLETLEKLREKLASDQWVELLQKHARRHELDAILETFCPKAQWTPKQSPLQWQCRCSFERVLVALKMMTATELAEMVNDRQEASVNCHFCNKTYEVSPENLEKALTDLIIEQGTTQN